MAILNVFAGSGGGVRIPLETPTSFVATSASGKILLSWTDPVDKVANPGGEAVATWNYTIVVRKVGSAPQTPGDGVEIVREHTRNQYQSTTYADELYIENGVTYHYAVFAVSTIGVWSTPATATAMSRPEEFSYHDTITITWPYSGFSRIHSAASTTNHAIFTGFAPGAQDDETYPYIVAVTKDGSTNALASNGGLLCASASLNGNAYFAGGTPGRFGTSVGSDKRTPYVRRISPSLSMSSGNLRQKVSSAAAATVSDNVLIAGGERKEDVLGSSYDENTPIANVDAFNSSMTRTALQDLSVRRYAFAGASTENHAIFAGGSSYVEATHVYGSNLVDAYDSLLTKVASISTLSYEATMLVGRRVGGSAIFAGGATGTRGAPARWNVDSYNDSLTKQALDNMTQGRFLIAGVETETHVLLAGGKLDGVSLPHYSCTSESEDFSTKVDVYTSTLTKETLSDLPTNAKVISGAMAENMALLPMADGTTYRYVYQ